MGQHTPDSVVRDFFTPFQADGFTKQTALDASDLTGVIVKKDGTALTVTMNDFDDEADGDIDYGQVYIQNAKESVTDKGTVVVIWRVPDAVGSVRLDVDYAGGSQRYSIEHDVVIGVPDTASSENNTLKVFTDAGETQGVPRSTYTVRLGTTRVLSGLTDVLGEATMPLPIANSYKVLVAHHAYQFNELTFNVAAGGGTVTISALVNEQNVIVSGG